MKTHDARNIPASPPHTPGPRPHTLSSRPHALALFALALITCSGLPAFAQEPRPNPPALPQDTSDVPDLQAFASAYKRAGEPRIMVLVGMDSRPARASVAAIKMREAYFDGFVWRYAPQRFDDVAKDLNATIQEAPPSVTGNLANNPRIGDSLTLFDPSGDSLILKSTIEEWLQKDNSDIELVSVEALAEKDSRDAKLLALRDENKAVELIGTKLNADIVLVVRMVNSGYVRDRGAMWRVAVDILQPARGRKIGGFAFEWTEGVDAYTIKSYAQAMTRKFIDQFVAFYAPSEQGPANKYTVRLVGLSNAADLAKARKAFSKIPGVRKVKDGDFSAATSTSVGSLVITYAGEPLDLVVDLQSVGGSELGYSLESTDSAAGTITLMARAVAPPAPVVVAPPKARWELLVDDTGAEGKAARDAFLEKYRAQGSPKIALLISREVTDQATLARLSTAPTESSPDAAPAAPTTSPSTLPSTQPAAASPVSSSVSHNVNNNYVTVNVTRDAAADPAMAGNASENFLNARKMENHLYKNFLALGLTLVDPSFAHDRLAKQVGVGIFQREDLPYILGKAADADIVIHGYSRIDESKGVKSVHYTFRAVRIRDGLTLGAESWSSDVKDDPGSRQLDMTIENVSLIMTGKLADQIWNAWTPSQLLAVNVSNAKGQKEVYSIMSAFKSNVAEIESVDFVSFTPGAGSAPGKGVFSIRYRVSYDELVKKVTDQEKTLPFTIDGEATRETIGVKIKDGL